MIALRRKKRKTQSTFSAKPEIMRSPRKQFRQSIEKILKKINCEETESRKVARLDSVANEILGTFWHTNVDYSMRMYTLNMSSRLKLENDE